MRLRCLLSLCFLLSAALPAHAGLIAYWNFNTLNIPTAAAPGSGGVPTSIAATSGSGSLNLATWGGTVDDFVGSTLNTLNSDPAGASLSLIVGGTSAPFPGNNSFITFSTSLTGMRIPSCPSRPRYFHGIQFGYLVLEFGRIEFHCNSWCEYRYNQHDLCNDVR